MSTLNSITASVSALAGQLRAVVSDGVWLDSLPDDVARAYAAHGDFERWAQELAELPSVETLASVLDVPCPTVQAARPDPSGEAAVTAALRRLSPWRKGPFRVLGTHIDAEWRSDWKLERVLPHIAPLAGRHVLDVGSGNGYYCLRAAGQGAELVVGVDPSVLYAVQFLAVQRYFQCTQAHVLPLSYEELPAGKLAFDTVFSMGVLYHRRSPAEHLGALRGFLRPGGELVLETLVIEGESQDVLRPPGRYAKMRNVWHVPSVPRVRAWLEQAGFARARCLGVVATTVEEQRATDWMPHESLADFLDPADAQRTLEGHPAPRRAVFLANAP